MNLLMWVVLAVPQGGAGFERCDLCHVSTDWQTMKGGASNFDHDPTGFPLRGAHRATTCSDCHNGTPLGGGDCSTCHSDPHRGEHQGSCDTCHSSTSWGIPQAWQDHRRLRLPLVGRHAGVACADCHPRSTGDEYRAVPADCAECHRADALAPAVHPPHTEGRFVSDCGACHTAFGWRPARVAHGRFWPLTGAHRVADCNSCHTGGRYVGTPQDCLECHTDDFTRGHRPTEPTACADCHTTTAWLPATMAIDHDRFFPLPHEGISDCGDCHPNGTQSFSCMTCHTHSRGRMDNEHDDVRGYVWEAQACLRCHPRGDE